MRTSLLAAAALAALAGCAAPGPDATQQSWVGRSIGEAMFFWGQPDETFPLQGGDGEVYVFSRSLHHPAADNSVICEEWLNVDARYCISQERTETCSIHVLVRPGGLISRLNIVEGDTSFFGLCFRMLTAA